MTERTPPSLAEQLDFFGNYLKIQEISQLRESPKILVGQIVEIETELTRPYLRYGERWDYSVRRDQRQQKRNNRAIAEDPLCQALLALIMAEETPITSGQKFKLFALRALRIGSLRYADNPNGLIEEAIRSRNLATSKRNPMLWPYPNIAKGR